MQMKPQSERVSPAGCLVLSGLHFQRTVLHPGCLLPPSFSLPPTKGPGGISRGFPLQTDTPGTNTRESMQAAQNMSLCLTEHHAESVKWKVVTYCMLCTFRHQVDLYEQKC